jgi:general secretion pathway protein K
VKRQRGIAAITAILIVAVAASAATVMLAQQSATLDQAMLVTARAQADLYAQAGLDWSRGVLAQDARTSGADSLDEAWAQPIGGLPVERALVAGAIADEQGKFNLNNLVNNGQKSPADAEVFARLLESLGLSRSLADAVVDWVDADGDLASSTGAEDGYYLALARPYRAANAPMIQIEELYRVRGFDAQAVAKLKPHVSALGERTRVNINTATEPVLAAVLGDRQGKAGEIAKLRRARPFRSETEIAAVVGAESVAAFDVKSAFFSVRIQVSQDNVQLATEALVKRAAPTAVAAAPTTVVWRRHLY